VSFSLKGNKITIIFSVRQNKNHSFFQQIKNLTKSLSKINTFAGNYNQYTQNKWETAK
jgi:hypothetical protein